MKCQCCERANKKLKVLRKEIRFFEDFICLSRQEEWDMEGIIDEINETGECDGTKYSPEFARWLQKRFR